jgi:hypothetical protein
VHKTQWSVLRRRAGECLVIILSVGMPRAGSGWHYNLIQDLMRTAGAADAPEIRERFRLQGILTAVNCNIGTLSPRRMAMAAVPAMMGHTFVIKAHSRPTLSFGLMRALGLVRATYIYRDPRDAMLSAMDYGNRSRAQHRRSAFSHLTDFAAALQFMMGYLRIWEGWVRQSGVLVARYEDLLQQYEVEARRLVEFLRIDPKRDSVLEVLQRYRPAAATDRPGTHFVRGRIGRFRQEFSVEQQAILAERFGMYLSRMGYVV